MGLNITTIAYLRVLIIEIGEKPLSFNGGGSPGYIYIYMGVSLNGGTPQTPQNDHF